jgi:4'-phosphopantetheinyl transferase
LRYELAAGVVHVWQASLDVPEEVIERLLKTLSPDEQERAQRYKFEKLRADFTVARGFLRETLSGYLGEKPIDLRFVYHGHGKPELSPPTGLYFNLSHTHRRAILAVTRSGRVGVDLEWMDRKVELAEIASRFFAPAESAGLKTLGGESLRRAFFAVWTRKEAFVKACGEGISLGLDQFEVSVSPDDPARLLNLGGSATAAAAWSLQSLAVPPGYAGTVAVESPSCRVEIRPWPGS